jgi:hypothetical protein
MFLRLVLAAATAWVLIVAPASARIQLPDPIPAVLHNPADELLDAPIEDFGYDPATRCDDKRRRGMEAFTAWLEDSALGVSWGTYRCEKWEKGSASLHSENRALDWHLDVTDAQERAEAERLVLLLLAPDKAGEPQALARRMGIEEIIWDCGYWAQGMTAFDKYSVCFDKRGRRRKNIDPTAGHRNHIHFGMTKAGAAGRTSFWRTQAS